MTIAVFGAGALGSLLAGFLRLSSPNGEIWLVGGEHSAAHLVAIENEGLTIEFSPELTAKWPAAARFKSAADGSIVVRGMPTAARPEQITDKIDLAIVAVKSYQTAIVAPQIAVCLAPDGAALTMQNGLGNLELLQAALGPGRATQAVTSLGASLLGPGRIRFSGPGMTTFTRPENHLLADLVACFEKIGLPVDFSQDLTALVWGKLVVNSAINPLTALLNCSNGGLLSDPASRELLENVAAETAGIARKAKIKLPYPYKEAAAQTRHVAEITAANTSSMLADVRRGSPTEIEAINGAVVRRAESRGIDAPLNRTLYLLVKALSPTFPLSFRA
jgi:2-dehydropantoate 2-reductase